MLVYLKDFELYYQIGNSNDVWTPPVLIGSADFWTRPNFDDRPIDTNGGLRLYFRSSTSDALVSRDYNTVTNSWSAEKTEVDTNGATMKILHGISVTTGEEPVFGTPFAFTYAAIPNPANGNIGLWRLNAWDQWQELTWVWPSGQVATDDAPSLEFVPFSGSSSGGQFYILYNPKNFFVFNPVTMMNELVEPVIRMVKTEGSGPASDPSRRFLFGPPVNWSNEWAIANGSTELLFDPGVDTKSPSSLGTRTAD